METATMAAPATRPTSIRLTPLEIARLQVEALEAGHSGLSAYIRSRLDLPPLEDQRSAVAQANRRRARR